MWLELRTTSKKTDFLNIRERLGSYTMQLPESSGKRKRTKDGGTNMQAKEAIVIVKIGMSGRDLRRLYLVAQGIVLVAEANGDAMAAGFKELREVWVRALERAMDLEPAIRADLQKEAISCSQDMGFERIRRSRKQRGSRQLQPYSFLKAPFS
ncbi:hypothetical protein PS1_002951 [Malus domestica]